MMICPICKNTKFNQLLNLVSGGFDGSFLYDPVIVLCCKKCGHILIQLSNKDKVNMLKYSETEYPQNTMGSQNNSGDLPGNFNANSTARYDLLFQFIKPELNKSYSILDIGCATGGFLKHIKQQGYINLYGIEMSQMYVDIAKQDKDLVIKCGLAEQLPYNNNQFDFLVADQVVEHLFDPNKIFIEAKRILNKDGLFCISVPNAELYDDYLFFDFLWFIMREHVQHFDLLHLTALAGIHGFELLKHSAYPYPMTSTTTSLPTLFLLFKYTGNKISYSYQPNYFNLKHTIEEYIRHSYKHLEEKAKIIQPIYESGEPLYIFGISKEFYYLYNNTNLNKCNIIELVDDTSYKQQFLTFDSRKIVGRDVLKNGKESVLITAIAHTDTIKHILTNLNFKGKVIEFCLLKPAKDLQYYE